MNSDIRSVKTIVLSELPKHEKVKYFQFLLDNDINFSKDEQGNYVALVKVLNPQFYNDVDLQKEKLKEENNMKQGFKNNTSTTKQQQAKNQGLANSNKPEYNVKSKVNYNKVSSGYNPSANNYNNNSNNVSSVNKKEFLPSAQDNLKYLKSYYSKFYGLLSPLIGVRPRKLNYFQLKYFIEEIYSIRFIKDTTTLRSQINSNQGQDVDVSHPFPNFIIEFLANKYIKKPMLDKNTLDILLSADFYKDKSKDIEIFIKFLQEEYDSEDLIFFLFVRSCIEKEMKMMFLEKAREEIKLQYNEEKEMFDTELYLSIKTCLKSK